MPRLVTTSCPAAGARCSRVGERPAACGPRDGVAPAHLALAEGLWAEAKKPTWRAGVRCHTPMVQHGPFVCLELRRCRGRPLLPDGRGGWAAAAEAHYFTLTQYLRVLLAQCCAGTAVEVFPGAGADILVPYQAFVRAEDIGVLLKVLREPFDEMRKAFQCMSTRKRSVSPELMCGGPHRFLPEIPQIE